MKKSIWMTMFATGITFTQGYLQAGEPCGDIHACNVASSTEYTNAIDSFNNNSGCSSGFCFSTFSLSSSVATISGNDTLYLGASSNNTHITASSSTDNLLSITGTGGVTFEDSSLSMYSGTINFEPSSSAATLTFNHYTNWGGNQSSDWASFILNQNATILFPSSTTGSNGDISNITLSGSGQATLNIPSTSTISLNGTLEGSGGLYITGGGVFSILGTSTYSGATTIHEGTLQAGASHTLSPNSDITLANNANAILDLNNRDQIIASLAGGGTIGGTVTLGTATLTTGTSSNTTFSGTITGSGGLVKQSLGTFTLSNSGGNTYSETTTIVAGTLQAGAADAFSQNSAVNLENTIGVTLDLNGYNQTIASLTGGGELGGNVTLGSGTLTTGDSSNTTFSGTITGSGSLVKRGLSTFTLNNNEGNTYSGTTTVNEGILQAGASNAFSQNSALILADTVNTTLDLNDYDQTISSLTGGGGSGGNVTLGSGTLTTGDSSSTTFSGTVTGSGGLTKQGSGIFTLDNNGGNTYRGTTTVNEGTLQAGASDAFSQNSAVVLANTANVTLDLNNRDQTIASLSGGGTIGGNVTLGTATLSTGDLSNTTFSGTITGAGGLLKQGSGTFTLSNSGGNIFNTTTFVYAGTLQAGATNTFSPISSFILANTANVTLDLNGYNQIISSLAGGGGVGGTVILDSAILTTGDSSNTTFSGTITGSGGLTKQGSGTFKINNSGGNTYSGTTTVNEGTLQAEASNTFSQNSAVVLANTANVTLDLNSYNQTITSLAGGGGTGGNVTLGSGTLTTGDSSNTTFSGTITGSGGLTKQGSGIFNIANTGGNTYSGTTTVSEGTLQAGASSSFSQNSPFILEDNSNVTLDLNGYNQTITSLAGGGGAGGNVILGSGTLTTGDSSNTTFSGMITGSGGLAKQGSGVFTLTSSSNAYMGSTALTDGTLSLATPGTIADSKQVSISSEATLDISYTTASTIQSPSGNGTIDLGASTLTINQNSPSIFSGVIQDGGLNGGAGGSLIKKGSKVLILEGINTYTGSTTVEAGILLINGTINSDVLISGGTLGGSGTVTGNVTVSSSSTLTHGSTFTIAGNVDNFGTINLGDSSSEIVITGSLIEESGSMLKTYVTDISNSLLSVAETVTIESQTNLELIAEPSYNLINHPFTFVTSSGLSGLFSNVTSNSLLINPTISYVGGDVVGVYSLADFSTLITQSNAKQVAQTLRKIFKSKNTAFADIFKSLFLLDAKELNDALNAMQPALFKGLSISQENNMIKVQDSLSLRLEQELDEMHCFNLLKGSSQDDPCQKEKRTFHVWADGFGDILRQKSNFYARSPQTGYQTKTGGVVLGIDGRFSEHFYLGALGAYTSSTIDWRESQGFGDIHTGYGGLYFSALSDLLYANASVIGGFSHYQANRNIIYPDVYETAKNSHGGSQLLSHLDTGLNFGISGVSIRPFDSFDYVVQKEHTFTETGASSYDLQVKGSNAILLRNELGLQFASCFCIQSSKWTLSPKISWVREIRVKGSTYTVKFAGTDFPFTVTGYFPNRNLISPGVMLTGLFLKDRLTLNLYYNGEFGNQYSDHNYGGQVRFGF